MDECTREEKPVYEETEGISELEMAETWVEENNGSIPQKH